MNQETKKEIVEGLLDTISGIADIKYQERIWIKGKGPEVDDYTETSCYITAEGEDIVKNYQFFGITESQYSPLKRFYDIYENFDDNDYFTFKTENELIHSPQWKVVVDAAKEVLKAFNYEKTK